MLRLNLRLRSPSLSPLPSLSPSSLLRLGCVSAAIASQCSNRPASTTSKPLTSNSSSPQRHRQSKGFHPLKEASYPNPSSKSGDQVNPVSDDRQEGVAITGLPSDYADSPELICESFRQLGISDVTPHTLLPIRTRSGRPTGTVVALTRRAFPAASLSVFPPGTSATLLDRHDVAMFVERSERLLTLSDDLRWLAAPEHFDRLVTVTEIPSTYGRRELRDVLERYANVDVAPTDIVFQFDASGNQTDLAWVVCKTAKDCSRVLHKIQELPVPQRVQYASLFGCAFLWSHRSSVFISDPDLDFKTHRRRSHVFLNGWEPHTTTEDFEALLAQLNVVPELTQRVANPANQVASFFLEFETVKDARQAMVKFHDLKREWKMPESELLFAYPRMADVRWLDEARHPDQDEEGDSDIEDPIEA